MTKKEITLGVGVTGVVGQTALDLLNVLDFDFVIKDLKLFASKSSAGKIVTVLNKKYTIEETNLNSLEKCHAVLFATDSSISKEYIPVLANKGILCVDKSSAFRNDPKVPLVIPEVNKHALFSEKNDKIKSYIVASANCVTTPLTVVASPLHKKFHLEKMILATYQSVSGSGKNGLDTLNEETKNFFKNENLKQQPSTTYPKTIAFNVFPFVENLDEQGQTGEESKIIQECKKILEHSTLLTEATSVRVPTFVGHCIAVTFSFKNKFNLDDITQILTNSPGIEVVDVHKNTTTDEDGLNPEIEFFATARDVQGTNSVFVSRIRKTDVFENGLSLWIACDNLRKGAALNALQIVNCVQNLL